jgi:hypothetical protein
MLPGTEKRKTRNSNKVNLILSLTFHTLIVLAVFYFAAREGLLGHNLKTIAITMEPKLEPKPPPKQREPEPAKEPVAPKPEPPKEVQVAKITPVAPPPSAAMNTEPDIAPPPAEAPVFYFDGGKQVHSTLDPVEIYKGVLRDALEFHWDRPRDMDAQTNAAEVEVAVSKSGEISSPVLTKPSGQKKWDDSVLLAIADTKKVTSAPPSNFPSRVVVRFYVEARTSPGE